MTKDSGESDKHVPEQAVRKLETSETLFAADEGAEMDSFEAHLAGVLVAMEGTHKSMLGEVLADSYRLIKVIGEGGMGSVFLARHLRTGGQIAVKIVHEQFGSTATSELRFELEAKHTASLDHPNIVRVFDYGREGKLLYLVMEHVPGSSLQAVLDAEGAMPWSRAVPILEQVLMALGTAHTSEQGLIHRDIKPGNILLTDYLGQPDFVKVVDFGISRALSGQAVGTVGLVGSPHTMAPEQLNAGQITPATDMYAVGCTAYTMLAGAPPFDGHMPRLIMAHLLEEPPPLAERAEIPEALADWVAHLMRKNPEARPQSAAEAVEALRALSREAPKVAPPKATPLTAPISQPSAVTMGGFVLERFLDRGSSAQVWRGHQAAQGEPVAVKIIDDGQGSAGDLQRELQAIARLSHPNIVGLFDSGRVPPGTAAQSQGVIPDGAPYLAMAFAPSGSLWDVMAGPERPSTWPQVRSLLTGLLNGLTHAHARGVLHLDVKPHNTLLWQWPADEGHVKLSDFGLARTEQPEVEQTDGEVPAGTPKYMAPEQFMAQRRDFGPWTDLYALGALAWELVCGDAPYPGPTNADYVIQHAIDPLPEPVFTMAVPEGLGDWLARLLAKAPSQRFQFARDAAWALERLEEGEAVSGPPPVRPWRSAMPRMASMGFTGAGLGLYRLRQRPLVGRVEQRACLWEALEAVCAGQGCRAVVLEGPLGFGKSRLASWLCELTHEEAAACVMTTRHEPNPGVGQGLERLLASHFRCLGLSPARIAERLERLWREQGIEDDTWQALTALLVGAPALVPGMRAIQFANDAERFHLIAHILELIGKRRPLVVWLDDVQWGAQSIAFVQHCLNEGRLPVLFVLTAGSEALEGREALEGLCALNRTTRLSVGPLSPEESAALVDQLLHLSEALARDVVIQMRGNPLFAVRLVEDWIRRDILTVGDAGLEIPSGISVELPDDLHQLWIREVERLLEDHPDSLPVLELAAALGQEFDEDELVRACAQGGLALPEGLLVLLQRRNLLVFTERGWAFSHNMFQGSLARIAQESGRWGPLNEACARMLQQTGAKGAVANERLARHLLEAGLYEEALAPLQAAFEASIDTSAFGRAERLLRASEEALAHLGVPDDDPRTLDVWLQWARMYRLHWKYDEAELKIRAVLPHTLLEEDAQHARALSILGHIARRRRKLDKAGRYNDLALNIFERLGDSLGNADTLLNAAIIARTVSELPRAIELYQRAHAIYVSIAHEAGQALCLSGLGNVHRSQKQFEQARERYEQALDIFTALGRRHEIANCHNGLGEVARYGGRFDEAAHHYKEALRLLSEVGSRSDIALMINLALLYLSQGRFGEASGALHDCIALTEQRQQEAFLGYIYAFLLPCLADDDDVEHWSDALEKARHYLTKTNTIDLDVAQEIERAGDLWASHGRAALAEAAHRLALSQWEPLDPAHAEALRSRIAEGA